MAQLRDGNCRFFGRFRDWDLIAAYFDIARWWGDVDHVMRLRPDQLALYADHAARIAKREGSNG